MKGARLQTADSNQQIAERSWQTTDARRETIGIFGLRCSIGDVFPCQVTIGILDETQPVCPDGALRSK
jgi:hypothetical protein